MLINLSANVIYEPRTVVMGAKCVTFFISKARLTQANIRSNDSPINERFYYDKNTSVAETMQRGKVVFVDYC